MTVQLTLWPDPPTSIGASDQPWPLGVWLRVYTTSLGPDGSTVIGRLDAYGDHDGQVTVKLVNARGGAEVPISYVVGVVSPTTGQPRTGFPKTCPAGRSDPVLAINCEGCEHRQRLPRGVWRCTHSEYQTEPGVHFCLGCGIELGSYAESRGWAYCGKEQCLKGLALSLTKGAEKGEGTDPHLKGRTRC